MAVPSKITLYDAEFTLKEKTLSPFSVRVILLLGYKNIAYENAWVKFPDIESTAKAVGAPSTFTKGDGTPGYSIPFISVDFADKTRVVISDSKKIAHFIEETYPDPEGKVLPPDTRVFQSIFARYLAERIQGSLIKISARSVPKNLDERSGKWWVETRKNAIGKTLDEIAPQDEAGIAQAWELIEDALDDLAAHLDAIQEGNFRVTGGPSYSEFELVSVLNTVMRVDTDAWKRVKGRNGGRWGKLMDLPLYKKLLPANKV